MSLVLFCTVFFVGLVCRPLAGFWPSLFAVGGFTSVAAAYWVEAFRFSTRSPESLHALVLSLYVTMLALGLGRLCARSFRQEAHD